MNIPYVKKIDQKTEKVLNPIKGRYVSNSPNRRNRKLKLKKGRFKNNSNRYHQVIVGRDRYIKHTQVIFDYKREKVTRIEHDILVINRKQIHKI